MVRAAGYAAGAAFGPQGTTRNQAAPQLRLLRENPAHLAAHRAIAQGFLRMGFEELGHAGIAGQELRLGRALCFEPP